ncbi:STAS/SEC14 domain-containing protein [Alkalicoccus chagannorensis]|uniref:STAS/SEC14 domain-containing protein n=1 Tax=Alkalicoccus chagannorensis TaxID=427072 RepID=UPI000413CE88|nr:STAS/SEC14 domain-containing protein [Alkalicoccus chagannorensis]
MLVCQTGNAPNIVEYFVQGKLSEGENEELLTDLQERIEEHGEVHLLVVVEGIPTVELSAIPDRLSFAKDHIDDIGRYALVSDSKVIDAAAGLYDNVTDIDFQTFAPDKTQEARTWVEAGA